MVRRTHHIGKDGDALEAHRVGLVTEAERQLEYHDSVVEALVAALQGIPTKVIAEGTVYNPHTVRRLKRGNPYQAVLVAQCGDIAGFIPVLSAAETPGMKHQRHRGAVNFLANPGAIAVCVGHAVLRSTSMACSIGAQGDSNSSPTPPRATSSRRPACPAACAA